MYDQFVSYKDYPKDHPISGMMNANDFAELQKALATGNDVIPVSGGNTGVSALRPQSLEGTLTALTVTQKNLKLWPKLAKDKALSTLEEYTRLDDLGDTGDGTIAEIATPIDVEETLTRDAVKIKFFGVKKEVSLAAQMVGNIVNVETQLAQDATMSILQAHEYALIRGNSAINPLVFDGFETLITNFATKSGYEDIVIDMEGAAPSQEMMETASQVVQNHYGQLDYMLMGTKAKSDFHKSLFPAQRYNQPVVQANGTIGVPFNAYEGSNGLIEIEGSVFIRDQRPRATGMSAAITPIATDAVTVAEGADSASKLDSGVTYYYWVSMGKRGFESAALAGSATTSATGKKITVTVADAKFGSGANVAEYMNVYRSTVNNIATATLIARVVRAAGGAVCSYVDLNQNRDNCSIALGFTWSSDVVKYKQLGGLMKLPLAVTGTSSPFMVLLYGAPMLKAPSKCVLIKNIGKVA